MRVAVIGAGYVGLVTGSALAGLGHRVRIGEADPERLAQSTLSEPVNLGSSDEMTVTEFADVVAELLGNAGRVYRDLPVSDPVRRQPDISLARSALGWEPTVPLVEGLQRTIAYLRDVRS